MKHPIDWDSLGDGTVFTLAIVALILIILGVIP